MMSTNTSAAPLKWTLTKEAFDKLLASFSSDRDEAGAHYEVMRRKLLRFFEWRSIYPSEDRADETINRVARRIEAGLKVDNIRSFVYGVARMVYMEALKERERAPIALETVHNLREKQAEDSEPDPRLLCFDHCLDELSADNRHLIIEYYQEDRRAKIELRQQLADRLSIPLNALRIRAHRIRLSLEKCIERCLGALIPAK